jgi:hypothetical protein
MKRFFLLVLTSTTACASGLNDIPHLRDVEYKASSRDPFIDGAVGKTLLSTPEERDLRASAPPIETYETELEGLFRAEKEVNGIALIDGIGTAIVNKHIMEVGEELFVGVPEDLGKRLAATSRYFGLGFEQQLEGHYLGAKIERITAEGLQLKISGMLKTIRLNYAKKYSAETIDDSLDK